MTEDTDRWARDAEAQLLEAASLHASALGWTTRLIAAAARDTGLGLAEAELLLPGGARDLAALFSRRHDGLTLESLADVDAATLKIRERISRAVVARCDAAMLDGSATRSWAGFLALPTNIPLGLRLAWETADGLWRWAGDVATDENHYSKRALLAEILISTLAVRLASGEDAASVHLDGRIAGVMSFEKLKSRLKVGGFAAEAAGLLGRLRYGSARL